MPDMPDTDQLAETREFPVMRPECPGCEAAWHALEAQRQLVTDLRFALAGIVNALEGDTDLEGSGEDGVCLAEAKRVLALNG